MQENTNIYPAPGRIYHRPDARLDSASTGARSMIGLRTDIAPNQLTTDRPTREGKI